MNSAIDLFLREHAFVHTEAVARSEAFNTDYLLKDVSDEQFRSCPYGLNSLAWLFWHMARVEDGLVSCIAFGRDQLFDRDDWRERLRIGRADVGTGMSKAEVAELSKQIDLSALWTYRDAVGRRTRVMVQDLWPDRWTAPIGVEDIRRAAAAGVIRSEAASAMENYLPGRTRESALFWWGLNHTLMHLGQVTMIHGVVQTIMGWTDEDTKRKG
jgi:DinB superfamily